MVVDKIERYLSISFFVLLILTQAMVFVVGRAASNLDYDLQASYMEPTFSQDIIQGEEPHFRAMLAADGQSSFSTAFFTLTNVATGQEANFEASPQADGSYMSTASWYTEDYAPGNYYLSATAQQFADDGSLENIYNSMPIGITLAQGQIEAANYPQVLPIDFTMPVNGQTINQGDLDEAGRITVVASWDTGTPGQYGTDFDFDDARFSLRQGNTVIEEVTAVAGTLLYTAPLTMEGLENGTYDLTLLIKVNDTGEYGLVSGINFNLMLGPALAEPTEITEGIEIVSPEEGQTVGDSVDLTVQSDHMLPDESISVRVLDAQGNLANRATLILQNNTDEIFVYSRMADTIDHEDGEYAATFFYNSTGSTGDIPPIEIGTVNFTVSHGEEPEPQNVHLLAPEPGSTITTRNFPVHASTSFPAHNFYINFVNVDDPAISLSTEIPISDGQSWSTTINLDDSFIDGQYNVFTIVEAVIIGGDDFEQTISLEESYTVYLQLEEEEEELPEEIIIRLHNTETTMTNHVNLLATSNFSAHGLDSRNRINWAFESASGGPGQGASVNDVINWGNMESYGVSQADNLDTPYPYMVTYNTLNLRNGNYYLYAWTGEERVESNRLLVTVFNEENVDEPEEELEELILKLYNNEGEHIRNGDALLGSSNVVLETLEGSPNFILESAETGDPYAYSARLISWDEVLDWDISDDDKATMPYPYILDSIHIDHPINSSNFPPEGEYYLYFQHGTLAQDDPYNVKSNRVSVALVYEQSVEDEALIKGYEPVAVAGTEGTRMAIPFATNIGLRRIDIDLINEDGEELEDVITLLQNSSWENLAHYGVDREEGMRRPYITYFDINIDDGDYYLYVEAFNGASDKIAQSNNVYFSVAEGRLAGYQGEMDEEYVSVEEDEEEEVEDEEDMATADEASEATFTGGSVAIPLATTCVEAGITDQESCDHFQALVSLLDPSCIAQDIYDAAACEDYLNRTQVDLECQQEGIVDAEICKDYLLEKYGGNVQCELDNTALCGHLLREQYLNRLVVGQRKKDTVAEAVDPLIGQTVTVGELNQRLTARGVDKDVIPLEIDDTRVLVARSQDEAVLEDEDKLTIVGQAVMIIDTDGDELSDDLEEYYGTDINNPDTDGDGYPDGIEIQNGYNPLGEGRLEAERTVMDEIILSKVTIEQPKDRSDKIDKDFEVEEVAALEEGKVKLTGKAAPNTWVALYLYSDLPLVMTTKTDASGNWSYDIKHSLADGHHRVYVTVNDSTGKIVKQSSPVSFLVRSAQAVTVNDYFDDASSQDSVNSMLIYYILGAVFLIVLALGIIIFLHKDKKEEVEL